MRRKRIIYLVNSLDIGGAERNVIDLAVNLDKKQFEVCVVALKGGPLKQEAELAGILVVVLGDKIPSLNRVYHPYNFLLLLQLIFKITAQIRSFQPDIVHAHLLTSSLTGGIAARFSGTEKIITTRHGSEGLRKRRKFARLLDQVTNSISDTIICVSQDLYQEILENEKVDPYKLKVVHNGIPKLSYPTPMLRERARTLLGFETNCPIIGVVANLSPVKGHKDLIQALAILRDKKSDILHLAFVGEDRGTKAALEAQVAGLALTDRVHFLGPRQDVREILFAFDIQVLPSYSEALSISLLEAASAARPLIVTNVGGNSEVVIHGETGLLVPPGQPEALANAIDQMLENPSWAASLGENARLRMEETFSVQKMLAAMEEIYLQNG